MRKYFELFDLSYIKHRWEAVPSYLRRLVDRFSRQRTGLTHRAVNIGYEVEKTANGQVSLPIIVPATLRTYSSIAVSLQIIVPATLHTYSSITVSLPIIVPATLHTYSSITVSLQIIVPATLHTYSSIAVSLPIIVPATLHTHRQSPKAGQWSR